MLLNIKPLTFKTEMRNYIYVIGAEEMMCERPPEPPLAQCRKSSVILPIRKANKPLTPRQVAHATCPVTLVEDETSDLGNDIY